MRVRAAALVCLLAVVGTLSGCGSAVSSPSARAPDGSSAASPTASIPTPNAARRTPPAITVLAGDDNIQAQGGSYCWSFPTGNSGDTSTGACADAVATDPAKLPMVEGILSVDFTFPVDGWAFQASFTRADELLTRCHHTYAVIVDESGHGSFHLPASGPAGDYIVNLFGSGPQGDYSASFRWRTPSDGMRPEPTAYVGILWTLHGHVDGTHGLNLSVSGLVETPARAEATVTATAANGRSLTVDAGKAQLGCKAMGGVDWWETDAARSARIFALGPPPFTYDVTLVLDGVDHHASASWPDDHVDDPFNDDPAPVPLVFDPPLQ
jgi:hypothetical protein